MFSRKKTVIVNLQGGLGNQMFQFAVARSLNSEKLYFDLNFFRKHNKSTEHFTARNFELSIFKNIEKQELTKRYFKFLKSKKLNKLLGYKFEIINQIENEFVNINSKANTVYLNGYFQSEKYFMHCRDKIINDFIFPELDFKNNKIKNKILSDENAVCIHIRRGDFLKSKIIESVHGVVPLEYYQIAIKKLKDKFGNNLEFYFFSDDIEFVKTNFKIENSNIIEGNLGSDSWKDMALMSYCKHHIVANSSFSWWGAWLSTQNGETYAPQHFFNPNINYNINDYMPENWQIIKYKFQYL